MTIYELGYIALLICTAVVAHVLLRWRWSRYRRWRERMGEAYERRLEERRR